MYRMLHGLVPRPYCCKRYGKYTVLPGNEAGVVSAEVLTWRNYLHASSKRLEECHWVPSLCEETSSRTTSHHQVRLICVPQITRELERELPYYASGAYMY